MKAILIVLLFTFNLLKGQELSATQHAKRVPNYILLSSGVTNSAGLPSGSTVYFQFNLNPPLRHISFTVRTSVSSTLVIGSSTDPLGDDQEYSIVQNVIFTRRLGQSCTSVYYFRLTNDVPLAGNYSITVIELSAQLPIEFPNQLGTSSSITSDDPWTAIWYFTNNVPCNNLTVAVLSVGVIESITISKDCACRSPISQDASWGATFHSVPLFCIDTGNYFIRIQSNSEFYLQTARLVFYTVIVALGNQEATCPFSCGFGKCYNGTCRCYEPYIGASCDLVGTANTLPASFNLTAYGRTYIQYNPTLTQGHSLLFRLDFFNQISIKISKAAPTINPSLWVWKEFTNYSGFPLIREICNSMGNGVFIIRIDSMLSTSQLINFTVSSVLRNFAIPVSLSSSISAASNQVRFLFYRLGPVTPSIRAVLNGTSGIHGIALVPGDTCGYIGASSKTIPSSGSLVDFAQRKLSYSVDFSCSNPRNVDYFLAVAASDGQDFTVDVTNIAPNCNCGAGGVCKIDGSCSCVLGYAGARCTRPPGTALNGTTSWNVSGFVVNQRAFLVYSMDIPNDRPIQLTILNTNASIITVSLVAESLYGETLGSQSVTGTNFFCNKNMSNRKALMVVSGISATFNVSVSMVTNTITSSFQTSGTIINGFTRLFEIKIANNQFLNIVINATSIGTLTTTLNTQECKLSSSEIPSGLLVGGSISYVVDTCHPGTYYLLISSIINQSFSVSISINNATTTCPNCCSGIGTCSSAGDCTCPIGWTGSDCSGIVVTCHENDLVVPQCFSGTSTVCNLPALFTLSPKAASIGGTCSLQGAISSIDSSLLSNELNGITCPAYRDFICKNYFWPCQYNRAVIPCQPTCFNATSNCSSCLENPNLICGIYNKTLTNLFSTSLPLWCEDQPFLTSGLVTIGGVATGAVTTSFVTSAYSVTTGDVTTEIVTTGDRMSFTTGDRRSFTTDQLVTSGSLVSTGDTETVTDDNGNLIAIAAGAAGGIVALLLVALIAVLAVRKFRKQKQSNSDAEMIPVSTENKSSSHFSDVTIPYSELILKNKIGEGAFGAVYKGEYKRTKVAIKIIPPEKMTAKEVDDFKAEANTMKTLPAHPNVVLFRGVSLPPDPLCIVLEYCKGGSLYKYIHSKEISDDQRIQWAKEIARGMLHLHTGKKGFEIIHRDLAARNILLKEGNVAAVADFGMARMKEDSSDASKTSQKVGPLKWMSPEAIENQQYSKKSDVFSYGVVLWEIVTQRDPWEGESAVGAAHRMINGERLVIPENCSPILKTIMEACWKKDPNERPDFTKILDMLKSNKEKEETAPITIYQEASVSKTELQYNTYQKPPANFEAMYEQPK